MKICIVRVDRMGDMVLTLPVIQGLKIANNNLGVDVVCSKKNLKICSKFNNIDKIFIFKNNFYDIFKIISKLRIENYDYIFTFSPGILSILISIFSKSKTKALLIMQSRYSDNLKSKFIERVIGKLFYKHSILINRKFRFTQIGSIHQTKLMEELVIKSGLEIKENQEIKKEFQFQKYNYSQKKICLVHLSSKWINKYFLELDFIYLLEKLTVLNINIVMTTDQSSRNVFKKIFKKYKCIDDNEFENLKEINNTIILDNLIFDNWISIINSSDYVITPECGCTHIASLSNSKLCVIYDADNLPNMIASEYAPWKKSYTKLISNDEKLIDKLVLFTN